MEHLAIESDLSVRGIKLGMNADDCINLLGTLYKEFPRSVYKASYIAHYRTFDYFNGGLVLYFDESNKLVSIAIHGFLANYYKIHFDGIPIFDIPRDVLINILIRKYGEDYLNISDLNYVTSKDGLLIYSECVFDYSELDDPYFKLMGVEERLSYFDSIFISSFYIGDLNED